MVTGITAETTKARILRIRRANICISGADIARRVGVTRQRAAQILKGENSRLIVAQYCMTCGTELVGKKKARHQQFCSRKCYIDHHNVSVVCSGCGKVFQIMVGALIAKNRNRKVEGIYCSKRCWGRYFGTRYGSNRNAEVYQTRTVAIRWLRRLNFTAREITSITGLRRDYVVAALARYGQLVGHEDMMDSRTDIRGRGSDHIPRSHIRVRWLMHLNFTDREIIKMTGCGKATVHRARIGYVRRHVM